MDGRHGRLAVSMQTECARRMQIREFQDLIARKYKERDQERGVSRTFMWFVEEVGELSTALVSGDMDNAREEFADVFAWLCTLANITDIDLEVACRKYTEGQVKDGFKPK
jgi:NTP pyrophosphatase (non-canonical NTP hydrolase)